MMGSLIRSIRNSIPGLSKAAKEVTKTSTIYGKDYYGGPNNIVTDNVLGAPKTEFNTWRNTVGRMRYEQDQFAEGNMDPFYSKLRISKHFGTYENPHLVPTFYFERVVCCVGGNEDNSDPGPAHPPLFYNLRWGEKCECADCGQVFQLRHMGKNPIPPCGAYPEDNNMIEHIDYPVPKEYADKIKTANENWLRNYYSGETGGTYTNPYEKNTEKDAKKQHQ